MHCASFPELFKYQQHKPAQEILGRGISFHVFIKGDWARVCNKLGRDLMVLPECGVLQGRKICCFPIPCITTTPFGGYFWQPYLHLCRTCFMLIKVLQKSDILLDVALGIVGGNSLPSGMCASFLWDNKKMESWLHVMLPAGKVRGRLLALGVLCNNVVETVKCSSVSGRTAFT